MDSNINQLLVSDVVKPHAVITLSSNETVERATRIFEEYNISSVPIINEEDGKCLGFVDGQDCVAHLVHTAGNTSILSMSDWEVLWQKNLKFTMQKLGKILDLSKRNPCEYCKLDTPLTTVIQNLSKGMHRMIILDENDYMAGILTQSTIIRYMVKNPQYLSSFGLLPHTDFGIGRNASEIIKVYDTTRTLDAFRKLLVQGVSGVAVIREDGYLITQLSAADLRYLGAHTNSKLNLRTLLKPVEQYLAICTSQLSDVRVNGSMAECHQPKSHLVKGLPEDGIYYLMKLMTEKKVHRIWIVDAEDKLFGVVTMTDIMKVLTTKATSTSL